MEKSSRTLTKQKQSPAQNSPGSGDIARAPGGVLPALCAVVVFLAVILAYSNHFHNGFHFDDSHTIVNNAYIRDLRSIPRFFTDGTLFSSLPSNQSYRPLVSASLAIDYGLAGKLDPFYFQLSGFLAFLLQVALLAFVISRLLDARRKSSPASPYLPRGCTGVHPANADTVNYIISQSDIFSTVAVLASFAVYLAFPGSLRRDLFTIPAALGTLAKPPAAMFAPLFAVYQVLFPSAWNHHDTRRRRLLAYALAVVPSFIACAVALWFVSHMTPKGWVGGAANAANYLRTQPYAALLYFKTFLWPSGLSADYDLASVVSCGDPRFWAGMAFVVVFIACAVAASICRRTRVIGFGMWWFILALLPTSLLPLAEVINDHRAFFPYAGLVIALAGAVSEIAAMRRWTLGAVVAAACVAAALYGIAGFATYQRNKAWLDEESLWLDVTVKSPKNARGLMNYGNTQMAKGDYKTAFDYFHRAQELAPNYPILIVNLAVVEAATGNDAAAENDFIRAVQLAPYTPDAYDFYARWLLTRSRKLEAMAMIQKALRLSPGDMMAEGLRTQAGFAPGAASSASRAGAEAYLQRSLEFYRAKRFHESVVASEEALKLWPDYPEAWNNIGAACNELGLYNEASGALQTALLLKPDFQLAANNLQEARRLKAQPRQKRP